MRIYLAGDLHRTSWRAFIKEQAPDHIYLDPTDHSGEAEEDAYTFDDKEMIRMADMVLAYLDPGAEFQAGTSFECGYADGLGKPVVLIDELNTDDLRKPHFGMHRASAAVTLRSVARAARFLRSLPR